MRGFGNHDLLRHSGARFIGQALTDKRFGMLNFGAYPGIYHDENAKYPVFGEVYEVNTLVHLDRLESNGSFYNREPTSVRLLVTNEVAHPWVYVLMPDFEYRRKQYLPTEFNDEKILRWKRPSLYGVEPF